MKLPESPQLRLFFRRLVLGLGLAAFFAWLALRPQAGDDPRLVQREFLGMGTVISVSIYLEDGQDREAAVERLRAAEDALRAFESRWRAWEDGTLAQLNAQLASGAVIEIPPPMQPLFDRAAKLGAASGGLFDVRIGRLVELWGFHDETQFRETPPPADEIAALVAALQAAPPLQAGLQHYGPAPRLRFDFGAIAKGEASDRIAEDLRADGYPNLIVNLGGNLRTAGRRGERAWRIGIRHPRPSAQQRLLATLETDGDEAVITSGDYERGFEHAGTRYHHLLDPRSGYPASGLQAVTVVADSGAVADAASTALFVAGPEGWREAARTLGIERAFVVLADGSVRITAALAPRVRFVDGVQVETVP